MREFVTPVLFLKDPGRDPQIRLRAVADFFSRIKIACIFRAPEDGRRGNIHSFIAIHGRADAHPERRRVVLLQDFAHFDAKE